MTTGRVRTRSDSTESIQADATRERVTPETRSPFSAVLRATRDAFAAAANAAIQVLPGGAILSAAVRGGTGGGTSGGGREVASTSMAVTSASGGAESPGSSSTSETGSSSGSGSTGTSASDVERALQESRDFNLYYLGLQERMSRENRQFSTLSNVLKARHDTNKAAIGNIR